MDDKKRKEKERPMTEIELKHIEKTIHKVPILIDVNLKLSFGCIYGLKGKKDRKSVV